MSADTSLNLPFFLCDSLTLKESVLTRRECVPIQYLLGAANHAVRVGLLLRGERRVLLRLRGDGGLLRDRLRVRLGGGDGLWEVEAKDGLG